jgi:hypothetical protein
MTPVISRSKTRAGQRGAGLGHAVCDHDRGARKHGEREVAQGLAVETVGLEHEDATGSVDEVAMHGNRHHDV